MRTPKLSRNLLAIEIKKYITLKHLVWQYIPGILLLWFTFCLPKSLFSDPLSTVLNDSKGSLLAARIADDGQWRFPSCDSVPYKYKEALIYFEDEYFYRHPGINPVSIIKALIVNIREKKVVRGGSTITSQVIRLSRKGKPRSAGEKIKEFILAVRLEISFSKEDILQFYATHAPYGGNVVGLETAAWRYFGRPAHKLSWGETATLAVLPNAPSLIHPGKNRDLLVQKRNRLLDKLYANNIIDSISCELAKLEVLPDKPSPLPQLTPHLLSRAIQEGYKGQSIQTTINRYYQKKANYIAGKYHKILSEAEIQNAAIIVAEIETGNVLAYVGNTDARRAESGQFVDIITSERSSGSILKPFLYAAMLDEGQLLPKTLVADIPTFFTGFTPKNFNKKYDGAVAANNALARSLNIPAVRMLREYGLGKFLHLLQNLDFESIDKPTDYYGLSLILGGAEVRLWDLASTYSSLARSLSHYSQGNSEYFPSDMRKLNYQSNAIFKKSLPSESAIIGAGATWLTFNALTVMDRPIEGTNWINYRSSKKIAWKTGTSFGHRDAWTIGITTGYLVGVWVGNADGEGRPGLTGANSAAPIMFEMFKSLPNTGWFDCPYDDLKLLATCSKSGYKASKFCEDIDTLYAPLQAERMELCPYHRRIFLNEEETRQVNSNCYPTHKMVTKNWFVLPTVMEWYYKSKNPYYKGLPPYMDECGVNDALNMALLYPKNHARLFIPKGFNKQKENLVFEAVHKTQSTTIHWHLDQQYLGSTSGLHTKEVFASPGPHTITLVDEFGERIKHSFEIISRED